MHAPPLLLRFYSIYNSKILQKQKKNGQEKPVRFLYWQ